MSLVASATLAVSASAQIVAGQTDTFPADIMGWFGATPLWMSGGGPGGASDPFLRLTSTGGSGQSSHMAVFNDAQWSGNFTAAGVTAISVDLRNLGATDLVMRLTFFDPTLGNRWVSNQTANLAAGSGWQSFTYQLSAAGFTRVQGSNTFADEMQNVSRMMFRHAPGNPSANGVSSVATLGIDNVHAVPEPASVCMVGLGLAALIRRRRK